MEEPTRSGFLIFGLKFFLYAFEYEKKKNQIFGIFHEFFKIKVPVTEKLKQKMKNPDPVSSSLDFYLSFDMWIISVA